VVLLTYAEILHAMKRLPDARAAIDDALAVAERTKSIYLGIVLTERARLARTDNEWARSVTFDERALVALETSAGKDSVQMWKPLTGLGLAKMRDKKFDEARRLLERALAIATKAKVGERSVAEPRAALASLPPPK
jgi:hypothetical protein